MGRPRKLPGEVDAYTRMQNTFWDLLKDHPLRQITVGTVTAQAGCNRGTFYYHYRDMDDLIYHAIEDELLSNGGFARYVFMLSTGQRCEDYGELAVPHLNRISLIVERGGLDMILSKIHHVIVKIWRSVLCPDGSPLERSALAIIDYSIGGVLSLLVLNNDASEEASALPDHVLSLFQRNAIFTLESIAEAQGLPVETVSERLAAIAHAIETQGDRRAPSDRTPASTAGAAASRNAERAAR